MPTSAELGEDEDAGRVPSSLNAQLSTLRVETSELTLEEPARYGAQDTTG
jgi:hypothetical protein